MFLPILRTTPLLSLFYRLLGARVSSSVLFNSSLIYEPHLVEIGDNSRIGENAVLVPHTTEGKTFICRKIRIGKNVTIGQYAQILPGATIGDNVIVGAGAVVSKGKIIRDNSIAWGNPLQIKSITPQELVANS
jgi:acetyltransferase-like isoleucine patch superfamily enzyme